MKKNTKKKARRQRWRRFLRFARDSLEANLNQFFDRLDTLLAFRILHLCYGLIMLTLFYVVALSLIRHLEERRERTQQQQQEVLEPQMP